VLVQTDAIRKDRYPRPTYSAKESAVIYAQAHRTIAVSLTAGRVVVFDATNLEELHRLTLYNLAERAGATLHLVWMWAPIELIARRLYQRGVAPDPDDRSDADWRIYARLARSAEPPRRPFIVLNSALSVDDQLLVLAGILRA
jgi:predicted kinase